jgi:uncharacterized protein YqcC (DUF446 family)
MSRQAELLDLLAALEQQLRDAKLWQTQSPSPQALASQQPFCVDTLTFPQWLQFMFLPRMTGLLAANSALPTNCQIAPMGEEYFRGQAETFRALLAILAELDRALS